MEVWNIMFPYKYMKIGDSSQSNKFYWLNNK